MGKRCWRTQKGHHRCQGDCRQCGKMLEHWQDPHSSSILFCVVPMLLHGICAPLTSVPSPFHIPVWFLCHFGIFSVPFPCSHIFFHPYSLGIYSGWRSNYYSVSYSVLGTACTFSNCICSGICHWWLVDAAFFSAWPSRCPICCYPAIGILIRFLICMEKKRKGHLAKCDYSVSDYERAEYCGMKKSEAKHYTKVEYLGWPANSVLITMGRRE